MVMDHLQGLREMLQAQRDLQRDAYGVDIGDPSQMSPGYAMESIRTNMLALIAEGVEALEETGWKPWATSNHINHNAFFSEMEDMWHFYMNLMIISGMTAEDLYNGYFKKRELNLQRQIEGYDGVANKCPGCRRALDDEFTRCKRHGDLGIIYCVEKDRNYSIIKQA